MKNITLTIDGRQVTGPDGSTILEIAKSNGIDIPTLCNDEKLEPFGSCFLCITEVKGARRLMPACATKAFDGMVVNTETKAIATSRKMCLELLLSDHTGDCLAPCTIECPGGLDPQGYIAHAAEGRYLEALKLIKSVLPLPASIGRVCPRPCENKCRRNVLESPVAIDSIKRFIADWDLFSDSPWKPELSESTGKTVAIVGAGPAGLTAAYFLAIKGHKSVIYEMKSKAGGMFRYGIPEYRLPYDTLDREIETITDLGVEIKYGKKLGIDFTIKSLQKEYDAVLLATGAWTSSKMRCKGEDAKGVWGGIEYLIDVVEGKDVNTGSKVLVVGGGNTAVDAARTAWRLGADVSIIYRRTEKEMPAHPDEIAAIQHEGIELKLLTAPVSIKKLDSGKLEMTAIKMELGEADASGRRRPVPIEGSEFKIQADTIISAIGQQVDNSWMDDENKLEQTRWGSIAAENDGGVTSLQGVFAAGDCASGADIAIKAIGGARKCADDIHCYLTGATKSVIKKPYNHTRGENSELSPEIYAEVDHIEREALPEISVESRRMNFKEVELTYSTDQLQRECSRCLECGCQDVDECELRTHATRYDLGKNRFNGAVSPGVLDYSHPFILREPSKCISCGRCIRACSQVQGITALGFVDRGFNETVQPTFGKPLENTDCESCGQCVASCPTGALLERVPGDKPGPFHLNFADSICTECGIGCSVRVGGVGDYLMKVTPRKSIAEGSNAGNLCKKGRFLRVFDEADKIRITTPMIRCNNKLVEVDWKEAIAEAATILAHAKGSEMSVLVSPHLTNEIADSAVSFAEDTLETSNIGSSFRSSRALSNGLTVSKMTRGTFKDVRNADLIIFIDSEHLSNKVIGNHVIHSLSHGGTLINIGNEDNKLDFYPGIKICSENADLTKVISGLTIFAGPGNGDEVIIPGLNDDELPIVNETINVAKSPVIVANFDRLNIEELEALSALSAAMNAKIVGIRDHANTEGHNIRGVDPHYKADFVKRETPGLYLNELSKSKSLRTAIIIGEDPLGSENVPQEIKDTISAIKSLIVIDSHLSKTAEH
jgi:formate dehydrogenase major subunit